MSGAFVLVGGAMAADTSDPEPNTPELEQVDIRDALDRVLAAAEILSNALATEQRLPYTAEDTNETVKDE